ncbi:MAG: RNA methyltransferase [Chitinophagaceae bacterium]|nr:RNA methyltransferase [Chitinophagaceae bacterium]
MLSKNEAKYIQSLSRKKQRQEERLFIAEGVKLGDELLRSDYRLRKIYATADWIAEHPGVEATELSDDELARISNLPAANQVLIVAEQYLPFKAPQLAGQLSLVLDGIQDPGNFGTMIRIADWFGIREIIAGDDTVELYNPKVVQATMGSFTRVNVHYMSLQPLLAANELPVYGAVLDGKSIYGTAPAGEGLLLIGNEGKGISEALLPFITYPVTIPRIGGAESLNAAVAAGIIVAQLKRS